MSIHWLLRLGSIALLIASFVALGKARTEWKAGQEDLQSANAALTASEGKLQSAQDLARLNRRPSVRIGDGVAEVLAYVRQGAPAAGVHVSFLAVGQQAAGGVPAGAVSTLAQRVPEGERAVALYLTIVGTYRDLGAFVEWCDGLAERSTAITKLDVSGNEIRQLTLAVYGVL